MDDVSQDFLSSVIKQFEYYKLLGEKTMEQLEDEKLFLQFNEDSNSIAIIVQHLHGNMMSRWTDFLTTDGEKEWRKRDQEFETMVNDKVMVLKLWNEAWTCLFKALNGLKPEHLSQIIYIRNQGHTVMEAINRQLAHYPYHIGQIVFLGKMFASGSWKSLSIPRNQSGEFNAEKFSKEKSKAHFTDDYLKKKKD